MDELLRQLASLLPLMGAFALALPIAWNREQNSNVMGLRTFPLVAVGTCAYVMIAREFIGDAAPDATARSCRG
jgi:putative Mg2+ transporter-C (MgtC) family protein